MKSTAANRPGSWWLDTLEKRARTTHAERLDLGGPPPYGEPGTRKAALKFFNAAYRAEQSGLQQAHQLAERVRARDPELARILCLYGDEEGWHRELLEQFLGFLGGGVQPMGPITRTLFAAHARATRMETIVLVNLMFETIGSATYRLALARSTHPEVRKMLKILTRDEAFHVPLNVYFLKRVLERASRYQRWRLALLHQLLFVTLLALPPLSRHKTRAFDGITTFELVRAYGRELAGLFVEQPSIGLSPPWRLLRLLGVSPGQVRSAAATSEAAAEAAAVRAPLDAVN